MEEKMEEQVQESVQELATESQSNTDNISDRESELLREVMQKKERLQKAESEIAELRKAQEAERQKQLEENEEWKTLAEERAKQLTPVVDQYKAERTAEKEKLLSDFPEEDREDFKELTLAQLRSVHNKIIKTKSNIPSVDTSDSTGMQGYATLKEAVKDHVSGKIDKTTYEQIKEKFTSRIGR
jgi:TolA-binding protein